MMTETTEDHQVKIEAIEAIKALVGTSVLGVACVARGTAIYAISGSTVYDGTLGKIANSLSTTDRPVTTASLKDKRTATIVLDLLCDSKDADKNFELLNNALEPKK